MSKLNMLKRQCYLFVLARKPRSSSWLELTLPRIVSSKNPPATKSGEIAIKLTVSLPETLFKEPQYTASISVPDEAVSAPVIDADVISNVENLIAEATGLQITID